MPRLSVLLSCVFLIFMGVLFPAGGAIGQDAAPDRDQVILRMVQFARAGRIPEAQETLREYLAEHPSDSTIHYNLACLDLLLNQKDAALEDLRRALENGYTNFRLIEVDPDLNRLREDPRFEPLVARFREDFIADFQASAIDLLEGHDPVSRVLERQDSPQEEGLPVVAVAFDAQELMVAVEVRDALHVGDKAPWEGGSGVLINLVHPVSPEDYDSRRYYSYAIHGGQDHPAATLVGKHGEVLLENMPALHPQVVQDGDTFRYELAIPWEFFTPYAPGLDPEMGLNIFYFGAGEGTARPVYSLRPEQKMAFRPDTWRRYCPVFFLESERSTPVLRGRLYDRLVEGESLGLQLALWTTMGGAGECILSIHDAADSTVTVGLPRVETVHCEPELNFFDLFLDMDGIPTGSYRLRARLTAPDGMVFQREFPFDNYERGWLGDLDQRIHQLESAEKSLLRYDLFRLTREVENRHPQSDASRFHAPFARLRERISRSEAGHSILPDEGLLVGGFETAPMTLRHCSIYLPTGFQQDEALPILMVLPPSPGSEEQLAGGLGAGLAPRSRAIVMVPQSHGFSGLATTTAAHETVLAMRWARELFGEVPITLVGLGDGADAALEASLQEPDLCGEVLLDGDHLFGDLEVFSADSITAKLAARPHAVPYSLTVSQGGAERPELMAATLRKQGFQVSSCPLGEQGLTLGWLIGWYQGDTRGDVAR